MNIATGLADLLKHANAPEGDGSHHQIITTNQKSTIEEIDGETDAGARYQVRCGSNYTYKDIATCIFYGELHVPIPELIGKTIVIGRYDVLAGFIRMHKDEGTTAPTLVTENWGGPVDFVYFESSSSHSWYRLHRSWRHMVFHDTKHYVPRLNSSLKCLLKVSPDLKAVKLFKKFFNEDTAQRAKDRLFCAKMNKRGDLFISFASHEQGAITSKTPRFEFATGLTQPHVDLGDANFQYRADAVMNVLNLYETSKSLTMNFYQSGVLRIEIDSGIGIYEYNFLHSTWASVSSWDELELEDACMHVDWDPEAPKGPGRPRKARLI